MAEAINTGDHIPADEFKVRVDSAILAKPDLPPPEAAADEIRSGILGPLMRFGNSLGLSLEQETIIREYASKASALTRKEKEDELSENPLLQLDSIISKRLSEMEKKSVTVRPAIRSIQKGIKKEINDIAKTLPNSIGDENAKRNFVLESMMKKSSTAPAQRYNYEIPSEFMRSILEKDVYNEITLKEINAKNSGSRIEINGLHTKIEGILANITLDARYASTSTTLILSLDTGAIVRISKSPDLPSIKTVNILGGLQEVF